MSDKQSFTTKRKSSYNINPLIINRWSPRSLLPQEIDDELLMSLFEAARWAPSSSNSQPWRFIYAKRNSKHWDNFLGFLADGNKIWAKNAAVLVVVISKKTFDFNEEFSITHQLSTGAAWENLALEATSRGIVAHGMAGFDYNMAQKTLGIPDNYDVMMMIAIGKRGSSEALPLDLQEREHPNDRKPLSELVMEGEFKQVVSG